jgi:hypothetical protein
MSDGFYKVLAQIVALPVADEHLSLVRLARFLGVSQARPEVLPCQGLAHREQVCDQPLGSIRNLIEVELFG